MKKNLFITICFFILSLLFFYQKQYLNQNINQKVKSQEIIIKSPTLTKNNYLEKLTIDFVFERLPLKNPPYQPKNNEISLIVTGDIILARSVNFISSKKNDFTSPFKKISYLFNKKDIVFINLESPLIDNCPLTNEGMTFCGNKSFIDGLKLINASIINIANNHFENYGQDGINQTISLLEDNNIFVIGNEKHLIKSINNKKFAFLGFNFILGGQISKEEDIGNLIKKIRPKVDFLIIMFHWGDEYTSFPNDNQKKIAYFSIDLGADLVVGNHPHWIQTLEFHKDKPIIYSHGNFVFDQMWSEKTRQGIIGHYIFDEEGVKDIYFYPIIIENYHQPRLASEQESKVIFEEMWKNSKKKL